MRTSAVVAGLVALLVGCGGGGGTGNAPAGLTVSQTSPVASTSAVPTATTVSVDFSEETARETLNTRSFTVISAKGPVSGRVVCTGSTATFLPNVPLDYGTIYTARLTTDVKAVSGSSLASEYAWSFTTVATGPGDPDNYMPFIQGKSWVFRGTDTDDSNPPLAYDNTLTTNGYQEVNGKITAVFIESNPENLGTPEDAYLYKDRNGITAYGGSNLDFLTQQLIPYQVINFPAPPGYSYVQSHKADLDSGLDLDLDGVNETMDLLSRVTVVGLDTVSVPAGTYVSCIQIKTDTQFTLTLSSNGSTTSFQSLDNSWYAPDVGPVKYTNVYTYPDGTTETVEEMLTATRTKIAAVMPTYMQYQTFENPAENHYRAFLDLRNNGQFITSTDIQSVVLFDPVSTQIIPAVQPQFISSSDTYAEWIAATGQFESSAGGESGYTFNLANYSYLRPGSWTFAVQPVQEFPFDFTVNFPGQTALVPVPSAGMFSQWNADDSLTLSWSAPVGNFSQYRVIFADKNLNTIFNGRVDAGVSQVTLNATLIEEIRSKAQLSLPATINWRMETRSYSGTNNYARSLSNSVPINWR